MIQTVLQIEKGVYPFGMGNGGLNDVRVVDIQSFRSLRELLEKKDEMQKKAKLSDSNFIIKLIKIYQSELSLHYVYEYVPYSLTGFIDKYYVNKGKQILGLNSNNFMKKISFQLTMLISYLARMKIEIDLNISTLGISADQKIKVYMNSKCRMGHKTEISLVAHYSQCKEKITKYLDMYLNRVKGSQGSSEEKESPNFVIKGNRLVFPDAPLNQSYENQTNLNNTQNDTFLNHLDQTSFVYQKPNIQNNLRQTQSHLYKKNSHLNSSKHSTKSASKFPKNHKNSFQFGGKKNAYEKCEEKEDEKYDDDDNMSDTKSFSHSRSVRIEFQQKIDPKKKKQRKDSVKVKITTFHEYELDDCNPTEFFPQQNTQQAIFQHFTKKFQTQKKSPRKTQSPQQWSQYSNQSYNIEQTSGKFEKEENYKEKSAFIQKNGSKTTNKQQSARLKDFFKTYQKQKFMKQQKNRFDDGFSKKGQAKYQENNFVNLENMGQVCKSRTFGFEQCQQKCNKNIGNNCQDPQSDYAIPFPTLCKKSSTQIPSTIYNKNIQSNHTKQNEKYECNQRPITSFLNLQQKVRLAKQKAEMLLSKYPRLKKTTSMGY